MKVRSKNKKDHCNTTKLKNISIIFLHFLYIVMYEIKAKNT
jgi:hypothetical protein